MNFTKHSDPLASLNIGQRKIIEDYMNAAGCYAYIIDDYFNVCINVNSIIYNDNTKLDICNAPFKIFLI